jgi:hypothetical protein
VTCLVYVLYVVWTAAGRPGRVSDYLAGDPDPDDPYAWWAPFWFTMSDGAVTMIEEQYLP